MDFVSRALEFLECQNAWGYHPRSSPAAEPTAWGALALSAHGRHAAAERACAWLREAQTATGQVGIHQYDPTPGWPTTLAVLAWQLSDVASSKEYADPLRRAQEWLLSVRGESSARPDYTGHDTTIIGWPWVAGTHSWVEPTALGLLALRACGHSEHSRARDAVRLLQDRLLVTGGCNYGNTIVLGQALLPHVQPTGLALLALADEADPDGRRDAALDYLERTLGVDTTPASLAYGVLGLAAHGRQLTGCEAWLANCAQRSYRRGASLELALLCLAALGADGPLIPLRRSSLLT